MDSTNKSKYQNRGRPLRRSPSERLENTLSGRLRVRLNISQATFAELLRERTGLKNSPSVNTIWGWERGRVPSEFWRSELEKLARELGVKYDDISPAN